MLSYYAKHSSGEDFQQLRQPRLHGIWVHGSHVTADDITDVSERYALDNNVVRDVRDVNELPRVEYVAGKLYVFLRVPRLTKRGEVVSSPLLSIIQDGTYITLSHSDTFTPQNIIDTKLPIRTSDTRSLLLATLAAVVSEYETLVHHTAHAIKDVGHRLRTHEVNNKDFVRFVTIEDNLNEYQMNLSGMHVITQRLRDDRYSIFSTSDIEAIDDIMLHIQQLVVAAKSHAQSVTSIRNAYSTIANNNLNHRVGLLTAITVLITLPNVFFGMYGMNVTLPFADEPWAYAVVVGFTLLLILFVYWLARRFKVL